MAKNPLKIMDTILRDAHQSQAATRMKIEDMIPILPVLDSIGYWSLECWGGATFDVCMRFLNEDPWERLRTLKKGLPNTKLQMLLRGQNILATATTLTMWWRHSARSPLRTASTWCVFSTH